MAVSIDVRGGAALVVLNVPPVNAIGLDVRRELLDAVDETDRLSAVDRVVLTGSPRFFAAGADAREFDSDPVAPHLPDVVAAIENAAKPWIAAINGVALGGGLEIALGCRYRIAGLSAVLGMPEVTLGVVPGAGGTQRLPRLVGLADAVLLISQGKSVTETKALKIGLIDEIADDPVQAALAMDLSTLEGRVPLSRRDLVDSPPAVIEEARKQANRRMKNQIAPERAIDLVAQSTVRPFSEAVAEERAVFLDLRQSGQAKALRHIFFAERGAKIPTSLKNTKPVDLSRAVVVGGGTMGASIAYALESSGMTVTLVEVNDAALAGAEANVAKLYAGAVARGLMGDARAAERRRNIRFQVGYGGLTETALAIEAAYENLDVKKQVFAQLVDVLPAHAVLATNTSYLDINRIAETIASPGRVLGLHFFSPAHIMKLLEIVRADKTNDVALATGFALAKRLRKIPVVAGVCDGFIGNRILTRYRDTADAIMIEGSLPWEIDKAMVEFGYAMGPYETQDLSGLDIAHANRKRQAASRDGSRRPNPIADRLVAEGRLGKKTGVGWYRYPGDGGAVVDLLLEGMIREEAAIAKIKRRKFSESEIRARLLAAIVNEAADILHEGIASKPSDIDLVLVHGYGFPRWLGGPMMYADSVGLKTILADFERFAVEDPVAWSVSPLLRRLIEKGETFADFSQTD